MIGTRGKAAFVVVAAMAAVLPAASSQASLLAVPVLDLELNEPAGSTVAEDTHDPTHLVAYDGTIGSFVTMSNEPDPSSPDGSGTVGFADWPRRPPGEGIWYGADELIVVPDAADGSLDPGAGDFTLELRFRTKEKFGNLIQKGQARTVGGQVKVQAPKGRISCMFKSREGRATAGSGTTLINDNQWHVLRCERTPQSVTMYIDGNFISRNNNYTGTIDNKKPWTLGGKLECDAVLITCDYFPGEIDYVRMWKG